MTRSAVSAAMCAYSRGVGEPRVVGRQRQIAVIVVDGGHARLVTVPIDGGPEQIITTDPGPRSARTLGGGVHDVSTEGDTSVFVSSSGGLWQAPIGGGPPTLVEGTDDARHLASPVISPDGRRVAYVLDEHRVEVADLGRNSAPTSSDPAFEDRRGRVLVSARADFALDPAWSADGRYLYWHEWDVPAMPWDASSIVRCDVESGEISHIIGGAHAVSQPRVSPDGQHLAFLSDATGWLTLWISRLDGTGARPVLDDEHEHGGPTWGPGQRSFAWSPSSAQIALTRNEGGFGALVIADVATSSAVTVSRGTHGGTGMGRRAHDRRRSDRCPHADAPRRPRSLGVLGGDEGQRAR